MAGYQLKITIEYTKPSVWRRVIVPNRITFGDLHMIIQVIFGWEDMHLHDFSFPGSIQHIGPVDKVDEYFFDDLDEDSICIDEYLKNNKWIRYTYDFGDDWRHKIILEQELPDYKERYPEVIKYKGNNFPEDSGGIFFDDEEGIIQDIFDKEAVNQWLKQNLVLKRVRKAKKESQGLDDVRDKDKGRHNIQSEDFMTTINQIAKQQGLEFDEATLQMWNETMNQVQTLMKTMSSGMDMVRRSLVEKKLEKLDLYFHEEGEYSSIGRKSNIKKAAPKRSHKEVLLDLQKEELREISTALGICFAKSWNKEKLASEISTQIQGHPEYLYYLLNGKEFREFLRFVQAPEGNYSGKLPIYVMRTMLWWGYLDIDFWTGAEMTVTMSMPKEIEDMVKGLEDTEWRKKCGNIEKTAEEMKRLLLYYGCVELDKFYTMCTKVLRPMEQEEFLHYIYFTIDGHGHIWVIEEDNIKYICFGELDIEGIMDCREEYMQGIDYCDLTLLDVQRWKKGLQVVYPQWEGLIHLLYQYYMLSLDDINEFINFELYPMIVEGNSLTDAMSVAEDLVEMESVQEWFQMWEVLQDIFLHTRIAGLKGYTRVMLAERNGGNPFSVTALEEEYQEKQVKTEAHMHETPLEYQQQICELIKEEEDSPDLVAKKLEKLLEKYNKKHYESRLLLARVYRESNQLEKSRDVLKELIEDIEDSKLKELLAMWEKEDGVVSFHNKLLNKRRNKKGVQNIEHFPGKGKRGRKE